MGRCTEIYFAFSTFSCNRAILFSSLLREDADPDGLRPGGQVLLHPGQRLDPLHPQGDGVLGGNSVKLRDFCAQVSYKAIFVSEHESHIQAILEYQSITPLSYMKIEWRLGNLSQ